MSRPHLLDALLHDAHFALRAFGRRKGWTTIAVLTLALGIGANTAMFSVVNGTLLHPLPYPDADRIALIFLAPPKAKAGGFIIAPDPAQSLTWRAQAHSIEAMELFSTDRKSLMQADGSVAVMEAALISPSFAAFAGQRPIIGRGFTPSDTTSGAPRVVMVSEHLWHSRFDGSARVLGRTLTLDGNPYSVVGVMPDAMSLPLPSPSRTADLWLPLDLGSRRGADAVVRLRAGVTLARATAELDALRARTSSARNGSPPGWVISLETPRSFVGSGSTLIMLWAAGALVLLIACVNVAHLLLARSATRERELAVRTALGAGRWRLTQQLLTESVMLTAAGCIGGVWLGWLGLRAFAAMRPAALARFGEPRLDGTVVALTLVVSAVAAVMFGLVGTLRLGGRSTHEALKSGAPSTSPGRGRHRLRSGMVVTEMALSAVLLVGATLLVRSVMHLEAIDPGFDARGLYAVQIAFPRTSHTTPTEKATFLAELAARARALPGVRAVTRGSSYPPRLLGVATGTLQLEGQAPVPLSSGNFIRGSDLSPSYFRVLGLRLVQGSTFTDSSATSNQIILNETAARMLWPGESAVGQRLKLGGMIAVGPEWREVVGVVANAAVAGPLRATTLPAIYEPMSHPASAQVIVRTSRDADPTARLRALIASMDVHLPPPTITSVGEAMAETMAPVRFTMTVLAAFAGMAVVLAAVGLYGVLAYAVEQRTREIGIRIALGATPRAVARVVVRQGVALAVAGGAIGLAGASWGTRLVASLLYGVPRTDAVSFAIGAIVLLGTALVASRVPARRATSVDPAITMRAE